MNRNIVVAAARGIIASKEPSLLPENGGHLIVSQSWAYSILILKMCLRLSIVKPLHAEWLKQTISSLESKEEIVEQGFRLAGIVQCFETNMADTLPLQHWTLMLCPSQLKKN